MGLVKPLTPTFAGSNRRLSSDSGHSAGNVAFLIAATRMTDADPSINTVASTYLPENLTDLTPVAPIRSSVVHNVRVKFKVWAYRCPDDAPFAFVLNDAGSLNGAGGAIWRDIEDPSALLASTDAQDNSGVQITIPGGPMAIGDTMLGIVVSGADTNESIVNEEANAFSGTGFGDVSIVAGGNSSANNGLGIYLVAANVTASPPGSLSATALSNDRWGAASIRLVPRNDQPTAVTGTASSQAPASGHATGSSLITATAASPTSTQGRAAGVIGQTGQARSGAFATGSASGGSSVVGTAASSAVAQGQSQGTPLISAALAGSANTSLAASGTSPIVSNASDVVHAVGHAAGENSHKSGVARGVATADGSATGRVDVIAMAASATEAVGIAIGVVATYGSTSSVAPVTLVSTGTVAGDTNIDLAPIAILEGSWSAPSIDAEWPSIDEFGAWSPVIVQSAMWQNPEFTGKWRDSE